RSFAKCYKMPISLFLMHTQHIHIKGSFCDSTYQPQSMSSTSGGININGDIIKMKNRECFCGDKAGIRVSESSRNPNKIYFICQSRKCKYFEWWTPTEDEYIMKYVENKNDVVLSNDMLNDLKMVVNFMQNHMQDECKIHASIKRLVNMNILLFCGSICNLILSYVFSK
ncbi:Armadillo-type fold containing protein, partial [Melia azedarach]